MGKDNLEKAQPVVESDAEKVDDSIVRGLRRRNWALVLAVTAGILFGGSCEGKLSCVGREAAGCSCRDNGGESSKKAPTKKTERLDY